MEVIRIRKLNGLIKSLKYEHKILRWRVLFSKTALNMSRNESYEAGNESYGNN